MGPLLSPWVTPSRQGRASKLTQRRATEKNSSLSLSLSGEGLRIWKAGLQITGDVFTLLFSHLITYGVESMGMRQ